MRKLLFSLLALGTIMTWGSSATADHLDCSRGWPGTLNEANRAWAECRAREDQEHRQMRKAEPQPQRGPVVCPLTVNAGDAWLNKRPITVTNSGNGIAMGVTLRWSGVTTSGTGAIAPINTPLYNWTSIGPGQSATMEDYANVIGGGYSASAQACVAP